MISGFSILTSASLKTSSLKTLPLPSFKINSSVFTNYTVSLLNFLINTMSRLNSKQHENCFNANILLEKSFFCRIAMKHMKPFVQTRLQYKINSRALQELVEVS